MKKCRRGERSHRRRSKMQYESSIYVFKRKQQRKMGHGAEQDDSHGSKVGFHNA